MKKLILIACLMFAPVTVLFTSSCASSPVTQNVTVQTLKSVGQSAETTVTLSAKLYQSGTITPAQARVVFDFYNQKFQPAFRVAVTAAHSDLSSLASPDVLALAAQLSSLVVQFQNHTP